MITEIRHDVMSVPIVYTPERRGYRRVCRVVIAGTSGNKCLMDAALHEMDQAMKVIPLEVGMERVEVGHSTRTHWWPDGLTFIRIYEDRRPD